MSFLQRIKNLFYGVTKAGFTTKSQQKATWAYDNNQSMPMNFDEELQYGDLESDVSLFYAQIELIYVDTNDPKGRSSRGYNIAVAGKDFTDVVQSLSGLKEVFVNMFPDSTIISVKITQVSNQTIPFYNGKTLGNFKGKLK